MNLLLLQPDEIGRGGDVTLADRRAQHIRKVLRASVGDVLRAGVLDGELGQAEVLGVSGLEVRLRYRPGALAAPALPKKTLVLAVPRPIVLSRCLQHAAALGFGHIVLVRTARTEKAHLDSHKLHPETMNGHLRLGLEQGLRTRVPVLSLRSRFKPFVEDELGDLVPSHERYLAHLDAPDLSRGIEGISMDYCLAIGPEGGWVPFEVELLEAAGFRRFRCGAAPLRVESAISYVSGRLDALAGTQREA